ncbi:MAG: hypothetical protein Q8Q88_06495 [Phenylobacterium sp.]|uniref:hypothetical protein n=1 Tax=Phenylobacterium sp. TaxID=1871053 RepID=UPI002732394D|nr:hypothetical protein [Phenylobacterium sp.]MDP3746684.1 hypothetical protein [Phenylobacterium sp.]
MLCLTIFAYGPAWRLLDERCAEVGSFPSRARALAAAWAHVRRLGEPRHALVRGASGWREILVTPSGPEARSAARHGSGLENSPPTTV